MPPALPVVEGVEHAVHDLPTGVRLHVAAAGPPTAPPVLLLHGWPQHWWCWREVIARSRGELRLLAVDLRGFGWSGPPADGSFRKDALARDVLVLLDALGIERAHVAGHDWGAWVGLLAALTAPERVAGLLLLSIAHPWQPPGRLLRHAWRLWYTVPLATPGLGEALVRDGRFPRMVLEASRGDGRAWRPEELDTYLSALRPGPSAQMYRQFLLREAPARARLRMQRLTVPARLVHGRRDPLGTELVAGLERHGDDATVELVDRAGHFLPEEAPALVAERLRALCGRSAGT